MLHKLTGENVGGKVLQMEKFSKRCGRGKVDSRTKESGG